MDRRLAALISLSMFIVLTVAAIVVSGTRPALGQGAAPAVLQFAGYLFALAGGVLLLVTGRLGGARRTGVVVLAALAVLVALEVVSWATDTGGGANIGAGLVRLIGLVVIALMTARVASAVLTRRHRA